MKINKCMECGGTDFLIQETIVHLAATCPDDKELTVWYVMSIVDTKFLMPQPPVSYNTPAEKPQGIYFQAGYAFFCDYNLIQYTL